MVASNEGYEATVSLLLDHGATFEARDKEGRTTLFMASWQGHDAVVNLLLGYGANFRASAENGWTALSAASSIGQQVAVNLLLDRYADIDAADEGILMRPVDDAMMALLEAAEAGQHRLVAIILARVHNIDVNDKWSGTMLMDLAIQLTQQTQLLRHQEQMPADQVHAVAESSQDGWAYRRAYLRGSAPK
ncbi:ankyrin repeat-containing domain protein [Xylariaceae sp. FL0255]|nr:ankyrin repeat-containing domain protein [Xylariaceae sp. FL0255]